MKMSFLVFSGVVGFAVVVSTACVPLLSVKLLTCRYNNTYNLIMKTLLRNHGLEF